MTGIFVLVVVVLGLAGGFTGVTYPLLVIGLGLCAYGVIHPLFALAFIPLAGIHYARLQNPLLTPPYLGRTGLVPVFGGACLVFMAISIARLTGVGPNLSWLANTAAGATLVILVVMLKIHESREKRMLALFNSGLGAKYWSCLERTGAVLNEQVGLGTQTARIAQIGSERDEIHQEIVSAGVDPDRFSRFLVEKALVGEIPEAVL